MLNEDENKMAGMEAYDHSQKRERIINFYLCNGKCQCNLRRDGKKNEYCYANGMNDHCKYTNDEKYAKHKNRPRAFDKKGPYILDGVETYYLWEKEK